MSPKMQFRNEFDEDEGCCSSDQQQQEEQQQEQEQPPHLPLTYNRRQDVVRQDSISPEALKSILAIRKPPTRSCLCHGGGGGDDSSLSTVTTIACGASSSSSLDGTTASLLRDCADEGEASKSVHFCNDLVTATISSDQPLTEDEIQAMWWAATDFGTFRKFSRHEVHRAQAMPEFITEFQFVYEACKSGNLFDQLKTHSEYGRCSSPKRRPTTVQDAVKLTDCIRIVGTEFRGLEQVVFRKLYTDRRSTIKTVLSIQDKLPGNNRQLVLASKSRFLSRKARQMARILASADQAAADLYYNQDDDADL